MSIGKFNDKNYRPNNEEIIVTTGTVKNLWKDIIKLAETEICAKGELKFYGKNYGWALRYTKKGKSLVALYPRENEFTVQIILDSKQVEEALKSGIGDDIKDIIINTTEIHEGKWIYIEVKNEENIDGIKKLIKIRVS